MNIIKALLFVVLFLFSVSSCKKEEKVMPPLTFTGENTFGCYINGKLFVPEREVDFSGSCGGAGGEYYLVYHDSTFKSLNINGGNCTEDRAIQIRLNAFDIRKGVFSITYSLNQFPAPGTSRAYYRVNSKFFVTDSIRTGTCELLKFDTINNIASGTFAFEAYNVKDSSIIQVTDGRFDIKFDSFK